jgi:hypothetical protein
MTTFVMARTIRTTVNWRDADGGLAQNVLHYAKPDSAPVQSDVDLAAEFGAKLFYYGPSGHQILDHISEDIELESCTARTIDPANPLEAVHVIANAGVQAGVSVPLESAVVVTLYTSLASRRGRGRIFIPGLNASAITAGRLGSSASGDFQDAVDGWPTQMASDSGLDWVVWSPTDNVSRDVDSGLVRTTIHHQRRRNS